MSETATATAQMGAAARLRAHTASLESAIVDVKAPSGFVYKFKKPSRFGLLFQMGTLPMAATALAVGEWQQDGIGAEGDGSADSALSANLKAAFELRDRVIELSHEPKFVIGDPANDNEVSTNDVPDTDLEYLFNWVAAGGDASGMLGNFPAGSQQRPMASASRRKVRTAAEPVGTGD